MKNFNWESFTQKIAVKSSISELYDAWTISEKIEKWFLSEATFYNSTGEALAADQQVTQAGSYKWQWFLYDDIEKGRITQANGTDFLQFTFAGECLVDIHLTQVEGAVMVELTQKNIPTDDNSKQGIRLGCASGWAFFLLNLKSVYEGGIDLRNKNESLKGMLNN
ncbi:activator of Hsp90 ATPase-like protein [Roseivirga ehrenbergii]|uniref:Activator of Hsp90 ATPase homologue 1/2-like C-terminal domain-containing protein n=1 Tax=Roseivirga ehrenbergii (strain DSM 102268 / JCM 13514 / KCTC 12282 / NCIMB 14502 / KMM 6017) TaxID=279360 RepID=A0A150X775_ROSEK|nr:SRPBCC domain-containing protein [Roseivirga ehrenbergii]KYG74534.1 hypothetical protein MB14_04805 [Roseivirga ehrenbergii]TCL14154.1 activator of Hsp90 ATPase-like protein [Roseivirga ehrenbergii]